MSKFNSIRELSQKRKFKKTNNDKFEKNRKLEEEELNEEEKEEIIDYPINKKINIEEKIVNIFEQNYSIDEENLNKNSENLTIKNEFSLDIETQAKKIIPDLKFDSFELKKKIRKNKINQDDVDSVENFHIIEDKELTVLLKEINGNFAFNIKRSKEQIEKRKELPIYMKESEILDAINSNLVTIVCGETGSGI